jgi:alpha-tubulin suppressor-like RCC1 family protein
MQRRILGSLLPLIASVTVVLGLGQLPAAATTTPLTGAVSVVGGGAHSCARMRNGQVRCWGANGAGALGGGADDDSGRAVLVQNPTGTGPLTGVAQLASYADGACAVLTTHEVVCWGANAQGERGVGTTALQPAEPTYVLNPAGSGHLTGVRSVASSSGHVNCAVLLNGQARCWGRNVEGELGNGTTSPSSAFPVAVRRVSGPGRLTGIGSIDLGATHACARLTNGQARCWGDNDDGQLGDGTVQQRHRPVAVRKGAGLGNLTNVVSLGLGDNHSCAVLTSGQARCWGDNNYGRLGDGSDTDRHRPVRVKNRNGSGPLTGVVSISAGLATTCARISTRQGRCWGADIAGVLGNGPGDDNPLPGAVLSVSGTGRLTGVTSLSNGSTHACAVVAAGGVRCWGSDEFGQDGDDALAAARELPVVVVRS